MKEDLVKLHHKRSQKDFPELKLEENEYVELAIKRARIGIAGIWGMVAAGYVALSLAVLALINVGDSMIFQLNGAAKSYLYMLVFALYAIMLVLGFVATVTYNSNRLYITNKRLIHKNATSLFAHSINIIDLGSVEDVSFSKSGIVDYLFHVGTLRLSTVGDETTYTFKYANTPREELDTITHLIHLEKERTKDDK